MLINAIRRVIQGEIYLSDKIASRLLSKFVGGRHDKPTSPVDSLSDRELEVFQLIGRGYATRQIAEELHLSVKTVETYRERIKDKLQLDHANELVQHAINWFQNTSRESR
jgi:DNA-binding NarL/FixJ family response regulator